MLPPSPSQGRPPAFQGHPPAPTLQDVSPSPAWYWGGVLLTPLSSCLALALATASPSSGSAITLLGPFLTVLTLPVSVGILIAVYVTRSSRIAHQRMHHAHCVRLAMGHPAYPVHPAPPPPRVPAKDLRPRRLWYLFAVLCPPLSILVALVLAGVFGGTVAEEVLPLALPLGLVAALGVAFAVGLKRAEHRGRIVREHMAREWEQARRG